MKKTCDSPLRSSVQANECIRCRYRGISCTAITLIGTCCVFVVQGESEKETNEWVDAIRGQIEKQLALQIAPESPAKSRRESSNPDEDSGGGDIATNLKSSDIDRLHKVR